MTLDTIVIIFYFVAVLMIGIKVGRSVKTAQDFTTGNRSYSAAIIFATLSSAFIGGGFTSGLAEKVFSVGIVYVVAMWGFSLKEIWVATVIAPRMVAFKDAVSVGDIMGRLYGPRARILTGLASALVCAGIAGAQFGAFGYILEVLMGIQPIYGVLLGAIIVILYASLGGMKAVVANDVIHFCVLIIALPLVFIFGLIHGGGMTSIIETTPNSHWMVFDQMPILAVLGLFLNFFFGETLVPPYVQRLLIGRNFKETARGTLWSGLLSIAFFALVGGIGLIALHINPAINPNLALPYVISTVMPVGLKGLAIAGMIAVIMSSADAFLNAAAIAITQDIVIPLKQGMLSSKKELAISRLSSLLIGLAAVIFSLSIGSVLDILLYAYNFWTPFILVPLVAGILGYRGSAKCFWYGACGGIGSVIVWNLWLSEATGIDGALVGIAANFVIFSGLMRMERPISVSFAS